MVMFRQLIAAASGLLLYLMMNTAGAEVVVVISAENTINELTSKELEDIFLGRRNSFPNGEPAVPIDQKVGLPARREFYANYLGRTTTQVRKYWAKLIFTGRGRPPRSVSTGAAAAAYVSENPHAITYIDSSLVDDRLKVIQIE